MSEKENSHEPLVSVIVPVYNVRPYIHEALDSVLAQDYKNLEVILVDDGSTDGSGQVCDEYAARDKRFTVIHQANAGLSAARNAGLASMHGELVAYLDPDDAYYPDFMSMMVEAMMREDVDIVMCNAMMRDTIARMKIEKQEQIYFKFAGGGGKKFARNSQNHSSRKDRNGCMEQTL